MHSQKIQARENTRERERERVRGKSKLNIISKLKFRRHPSHLHFACLSLHNSFLMFCNNFNEETL